MNLMIADDSPSEVSDAIKNALYQEAERIEFRPYVADVCLVFRIKKMMKPMQMKSVKLTMN